MNIQQLSKDGHTESPHDHRGVITTKENSAAVDEFKYGFPSHGLSSNSYKWWGVRLDGGNSQQSQVTDTKETQQQTKSSADDADSQWTSSLTALRKRAVEDGRKALRFGVYKGYSVKNLDRAKKMVLAQIFKSELPGDWEDLSSEF